MPKILYFGRTFFRQAKIQGGTFAPSPPYHDAAVCLSSRLLVHAAYNRFTRSTESRRTQNCASYSATRHLDSLSLSLSLSVYAFLLLLKSKLTTLIATACTTTVRLLKDKKLGSHRNTARCYTLCVMHTRIAKFPLRKILHIMLSNEYSSFSLVINGSRKQMQTKRIIVTLNDLNDFE